MDNQSFRFQVNIGGIIDLFSHHLYSSPKVFVRELMQNAVDAITAASLQNPDAPRRIEIKLFTGDTPRIHITDTGTGLTLEEIHQFLSTIGESSKRGDFENSEDFIGRFGIGLLSGFLVSDVIELHTKSVKSGEGYIWKGRQNGLYDITPAEVEAAGSTVVLYARPDSSFYFEENVLRDLVSFYGDILPYPVFFSVDSGPGETINQTAPPWLTPSISTEREIMEYGETYFEEKFMGFIPLKSASGGVDGVAYILDRRVSPAAQTSHRVYLRNMLLSESGKGLFPSWAFFLRAVVNTTHLRPTASREDFYEDDLLEQTRQELGRLVKDYLKKMAETDPDLMDRFIEEHHLALKALAVEDEEILEFFMDYFPFETSLGTYTFKEIRENAPAIKYVTKVDQFRQLAPVFGAGGQLLVNAGYVYDADLMMAVQFFYPDILLEQLSAEDALFAMEDLSFDEHQSFFELEKAANEHLEARDCRVEIKKFNPRELPALLLINEEASFLADLRYSKETASPLFAEILDQFDKATRETSLVLCLNADNTLIRRLAEKNSADGTVFDLIYVQSMLMARRPLKREEMNILNTGILNLIERTL